MYMCMYLPKLVTHINAVQGMPLYYQQFYLRMHLTCVCVCVLCVCHADGVVGNIGGARAQLAQARDLLGTALGKFSTKA